MLLFLSRCCCQQWPYQQYDPDRKSWHERLFGSDNTKNQRIIHTITNPYIRTVPLSLHEMSTNRDFYTSGRSYGTAEENFTTELRSLTVVTQKTSNLNSNTERNIRKNYVIQQSLSYDEYPMKHNQEIRTVPGPTITTIHMATERIMTNPNWERADLFEIQYDGPNDLSFHRINNQLPSTKETNAIYITNHSLLSQQTMEHENQHSISYNDKYSYSRNKNVIIEDRSQSSDDNDSTSSEMSGHDSESIYEIIPVSTIRTQSSALLNNEDEYKTAGIDEVEIKIKDLICNDIIFTNKSGTFVLSSSSTLLNFKSAYHQDETNRTGQSRSTNK